MPATPSVPADVVLTPFYRTHRRTYSVYFDVVTPQEFDARASTAAAERERVRRMELATLAFVQPGEMQPERDYNYQSDPADRLDERTDARTALEQDGSRSIFQSTQAPTWRLR